MYIYGVPLNSILTLLHRHKDMKIKVTSWKENIEVNFPLAPDD